ncbi:WAT1-related protein [Apostasia shenzhenica]|uniref:WAT1-related protein n=1 Tax=Apostasia shenzhenica TaxID=1088818 RepID=A0A2I0A9I5_9ASPA|nr:WAT1-related protein [Apostasia shenzhenica]
MAATLLTKAKPYAAMVFQQFSFAVMYVFLLATLKKGMNQSALFVYRNIIAAAVMLPFALLFERPGFDQNFYYLGAKLTSASFASALENINPSITFMLALLLRIFVVVNKQTRLEKLNIRHKHGQAKVFGALLTMCGAIFMVLFKGPNVEFPWNKGRGHNNSVDADATGQAMASFRVLKGTAMILISSISWCSFLILQSNTLESYPAKITLTTLICSMGAVINAVVALVVERGSSHPWVIGWDMRLFAVVYSGVVCSGLTYFLLGTVMREKGPAFASAFSPLCMIMTAIMGSIFLAEKIALGMMIGAIIIVAGFYFFLWGKSNDHHSPPSDIEINTKLELPVSSLTLVSDKRER